MQTSWEKLVQFMGTNYGQDIHNELQNKISVMLTKPVHTPEVLARHAIQEQMVCTRQENIQQPIALNPLPLLNNLSAQLSERDVHIASLEHR
jgi:hypothetical protein